MTEPATCPLSASTHPHMSCAPPCFSPLPPSCVSHVTITQSINTLYWAPRLRTPTPATLYNIGQSQFANTHLQTDHRIIHSINNWIYILIFTSLHSYLLSNHSEQQWPEPAQLYIFYKQIRRWTKSLLSFRSLKWWYMMKYFHILFFAFLFSAMHRLVAICFANICSVSIQLSLPHTILTFSCNAICFFLLRSKSWE